MLRDKVIELEQKVADLEAALEKVQNDNKIWDRIFTESYWGMMICDAVSLELLKINPGYGQMHGYESAELLGRTVYDLLAPECRKDVPDILARIHDNGHSAYKTVHLKKDGSRFPVHTDSFEFLFEGRRLISVSVCNISGFERALEKRSLDEREKLQKVVEEEHLRLYTLFNAFPGLIYVIEERYKIRFANYKFKEQFGECEGQLCYSVVAGLNYPCSNCEIPLIENDTTQTGNGCIYNHRLYDVFTQPYTDVDGTKLYFKVLIDITDRKNADREYFRLERLNLVGEMAAGIAHEVRNPLTTVRGFLQLLSSKDSVQQYSDYFKIMIEELDRANLIITDFLSLAREKAVDFTSVNLGKIAKSLMPLLGADALNQDKDINLELESVPDIKGDENELRQLLLNLVRNGFEAMQSGGVLTVKIFEVGNYVVLQVADQGGGIIHWCLKESEPRF
ncbi:histidine kinase dimerization/phospho-acceptor domain-containing protein [Desulfosporosinus sp. FKA]|uniref:histidine kinase dimerization/phospho-acceptor domain-containing protein n=1 Tax=Desulfosporosinus sp. FKA TaxID=1969834 RepID=UPI001FA847DD|nr:histidine kinase dimerization/phospho-acceptor domain-containing protein [Desulfosporosinus sp. FKA]